MIRETCFELLLLPDGCCWGVRAGAGWRADGCGLYGWGVGVRWGPRDEARILDDENRGCFVCGRCGIAAAAAVVATVAPVVVGLNIVTEMNGLPWWHVDAGLLVLEADRLGGLVLLQDAGRREVVKHGVKSCRSRQHAVVGLSRYPRTVAMELVESEIRWRFGMSQEIQPPAL